MLFSSNILVKSLFGNLSVTIKSISHKSHTLKKPLLPNLLWSTKL